MIILESANFHGFQHKMYPYEYWGKEEEEEDADDEEEHEIYRDDTDDDSGIGLTFIVYMTR